MKNKTLYAFMLLIVISGVLAIGSYTKPVVPPVKPLPGGLFQGNDIAFNVEQNKSFCINSQCIYNMQIILYADINLTGNPPISCAAISDTGQQVYMREPIASGIPDYQIQCMKASDDTFRWAGVVPSGAKPPVAGIVN